MSTTGWGSCELLDRNDDNGSDACCSSNRRMGNGMETPSTFSLSTATSCEEEEGSTAVVACLSHQRKRFAASAAPDSYPTHRRPKGDKKHCAVRNVDSGNSHDESRTSPHPVTSRSQLLFLTDRSVDAAAGRGEEHEGNSNGSISDASEPPEALGVFSDMPLEEEEGTGTKHSSSNHDNSSNRKSMNELLYPQYPSFCSSLENSKTPSPRPPQPFPRSPSTVHSHRGMCTLANSSSNTHNNNGDNSSSSANVHSELGGTFNSSLFSNNSPLMFTPTEQESEMLFKSVDENDLASSNGGNARREPEVNMRKGYTCESVHPRDGTNGKRSHPLEDGTAPGPATTLPREEGTQSPQAPHSCGVGHLAGVRAGQEHCGHHRARGTGVDGEEEFLLEDCEERGAAATAVDASHKNSRHDSRFSATTTESPTPSSARPSGRVSAAVAITIAVASAPSTSTTAHPSVSHTRSHTPSTAATSALLSRLSTANVETSLPTYTNHHNSNSENNDGDVCDEALERETSFFPVCGPPYEGEDGCKDHDHNSRNTHSGVHLPSASSSATSEDFLVVDYLCSDGKFDEDEQLEVEFTGMEKAYEGDKRVGGNAFPAGTQHYVPTSAALTEAMCVSCGNHTFSAGTATGSSTSLWDRSAAAAYGRAPAHHFRQPQQRRDNSNNNNNNDGGGTSNNTNSNEANTDCRAVKFTRRFHFSSPPSPPSQTTKESNGNAFPGDAPLPGLAPAVPQSTHSRSASSHYHHHGSEEDASWPATCSYPLHSGGPRHPCAAAGSFPRHTGSGKRFTLPLQKFSSPTSHGNDDGGRNDGRRTFGCRTCPPKHTQEATCEPMASATGESTMPFPPNDDPATTPSITTMKSPSSTIDSTKLFAVGLEPIQTLKHNCTTTPPQPLQTTGSGGKDSMSRHPSQERHSNSEGNENLSREGEPTDAKSASGAGPQPQPQLPSVLDDAFNQDHFYMRALPEWMRRLPRGKLVRAPGYSMTAWTTLLLKAQRAWKRAGPSAAATSTTATASKDVEYSLTNPPPVLRPGRPLARLTAGEVQARTVYNKLVEEENRKHNNNASRECLLVVRKVVYDVYPFLAYHPGGEKVVLDCEGKEATAVYDAFHSWVNCESMLGPYAVGVLECEE